MWLKSYLFRHIPEFTYVEIPLSADGAILDSSRPQRCAGISSLKLDCAYHYSGKDVLYTLLLMSECESCISLLQVMWRFASLTKDPLLPVANPTTSFWQVPPHDKLHSIKSHQLPAHCDVAVIGSGISSCSVVWQLLTSGFSGSITVLEAREICSGATGRNGGRLHVHAVQDFDKFRRMFGDQAAKSIIRFQLAHYDELEAVARGLGPEAYERSAIRQTESVAVAFSKAKFEELKVLLSSFEDAFPDLIGRWHNVEGAEAQKVFRVFASLASKRFC